MWNIRATLIVMAGISLIFVPGVRADSLQLKNGNFVQGKYLGGTERAVQFEVNGKVRLYTVDEILSINFAAASADGGIPSNSVNREPNSTTELKSNANGLRTVLLKQAVPNAISSKLVKAISNGSDADALGARSRGAAADQSSCTVAPQSPAKTSVQAIAARSVSIPRQPHPVLIF